MTMTGLPRSENVNDRRSGSHYSRSPKAGADGHLPDSAVVFPESAELPASSRAFLDSLLRVQLLNRSSVGLFLRENATRRDQFANADSLGQALVQAGLLTPYQLDRVQSGMMHGLILGNHRVLERLGAGSMGVVFLGEHLLLKRRVAIKVLPVDDDLPPSILERFYGEMCVLADLHHPNIVTAFDAGRLPPQQPGAPWLHYLVMELVPGGDIEQYVIDHGILPIPQACHWIRQAACGLQEAHDHHLIHRDLKPSNLLLTLDGQVKLVDFGLARRFSSQITDPTCLLGSIEFMAPEQSLDPSAVDGRADIYGLGASLFWILSGQTPYAEEKSVARALRALQVDRPRRLRVFRPDAPPELDALIDKMMDRDPSQRPALPVTVMNALTRFATPAAPAWEIYDVGQDAAPALAQPSNGADAAGTADAPWKVLVVHDDAVMRRIIWEALEPLGCLVGEAKNGEKALALVRNEPCDLVLMKLSLPDMSGTAVCEQLRQRPPRPHIKIVFLTDRRDRQDLAESLALGADDCIAQPPDMRQLAAKVQYLLRLKDAQDRTDVLARNLMMSNRQLEDSLEARATDVRRAHDALLFAMAKMAEQRDGETAAHSRRLQRYCRALAEALVHDPSWSGILNGPFLEQVERCVPLHDIGKLGLPDALLSKPGPLNPSERALMETHTLIGANMLDALAREYGGSLGFLTAATVIVRYHHERWDGSGYPDGLSGDSIPPAGRIVSLPDVYDALRRKRLYKPARTHEEAVKTILETDGQFDPSVLQAFEACHEKFRKIYQQNSD